MRHEADDQDRVFGVVDFESQVVQNAPGLTHPRCSDDDMRVCFVHQPNGILHSFDKFDLFEIEWVLPLF